MNLFNNFSRCIKCGEYNAIVLYDKSFDIMKRKCKKCGFEWEENPLNLQDEIDESHEENNLLNE